MYAIQIDHIIYDAWKDGRPFTLAECWRELEGTGHARILASASNEWRVVLDNAGAMTGRRLAVRKMYRDSRNKRKV